MVEEKIYVIEVIVNMNVSIGSVLVYSTVMRSTYKYAMGILGYPSKGAMILTCSGSLKTLALAILQFFSIGWYE